MRKVTLGLMWVITLNVVLVSCYNNNGNQYTPSKTTFRAFLSNPLHVTSNGNIPAMELMDAEKDLLGSAFGVGSLPDVGAMDLSINKKLTLVYSPGSNAFALIDNATATETLTTASLPDRTESFFILQDNSSIYTAVPNAPVAGNPPGAVIVFSVASGNPSATLPIPHVRYLARGQFDSKILAFGDGPDITVITPANVGTATDPRVTVSGSDHPFDHPVGAAVSADGTTAYILECGLECGGTTAAVTPLTLSNNLQGPSIPVPGATAALRNGNTLYVAGTPPGATCAALTAPCGFLSVIDLNTMTLLNTTPIEITDGRHDRIEVTEDGQVFIGSKGCTEVGGRGCLSIVKGAGFNVIIPPDTGDVTGIAPVPNRTAVYVVEGGELRIYDTTTDQLLVNHQLNIVGQLVDVKIVDKAP